MCNIPFLRSQSALNCASDSVFCSIQTHRRNRLALASQRRNAIDFNLTQNEKHHF